MRTTLLAALTTAALSTGCAMSIPETPGYPKHAAATDLPGASFCSRTEASARSLAGAQTAAAWVFGSLAVGSTGAGTITTLVNTNNERRIIAGTSMMLGGIAFGAVAAAFFMQATASSRLAQATNLAMLDRSDAGRWDACVRAKAAWAGHKASPDGITAALAEELERENRRLRDEVEELKKKSDAPRTGDGLPPPLAPKR